MNCYRWFPPLMAAISLVMAIYANVVNGGSDNQRMVNDGPIPSYITCPMASEIKPCSCKVWSKGLDIVCDNANMGYIQNALATLKKNAVAIYWMKLRSCQLPLIKDNMFQGLEIQHLNIITSNVSVIEKQAFSALGKFLTDLDLSNNNIREIPSHALSFLKKVSFLNLNYNKISTISASAFEGMTMLERLSLYENKIKLIHDNAFKGIGRTISRLNLGNNKLSEIPTATFSPLRNLLVLNLNENRIKHIPNGAFVGLHRLDMLKLEHNEIESIQDYALNDLAMLNSLNIEHNKITHVSSKAFVGLESHLGWLELGYNMLDHVPSHALRPLHNLRQLDLDSNRIRDVKEDAFRGYGETLKFLLLDKNQIKHIPTKTFSTLHALELLILSHNELETLSEETIEPILDTLTYIDVSNNPLKCSCEIQWLHQYLTHPNNSYNAEATDDHKCTDAHYQSFSLINLTPDYFNCTKKAKLNKLDESSSTSDDVTPETRNPSNQNDSEELIDDENTNTEQRVRTSVIYISNANVIKAFPWAYVLIILYLNK